MATALPRHRTGRSSRTLLPATSLVALFVALLTVCGIGTAHAASGYKYWNYFHIENGKYVFAQTGPADFTPKNGTVEAYRYGVSSTATGLHPRTGATTYSEKAICAGSKARTGHKRVGVLLDYGSAADAANGETPPKPRAACAVVPVNANGQQVLDAVARVRLEKSLTCGIDGYPVATCSVTVKNAPAGSKGQRVGFAMPAKASGAGTSPRPAASGSRPTDGGVPWPLVGVAVGVVVVGGGALALSRRSRSA